MFDKQRGARAKHSIPEPIPDTPENIMRTIVNTPPKTDDEWRYLKDGD
ncbi:MAG: hypothetical protein OXB92_12670 [Acidimicrobiaceae bacterium]|nr:hypothetical protein [Acidimicrobiia bacterium]MCY4494701.1 hypothetical protein [Acidimicrobiaceae bacterium]